MSEMMVLEFKEIMKAKYKLELSDQQASELSLVLVQLFKLLGNKRVRRGAQVENENENRIRESNK